MHSKKKKHKRKKLYENLYSFQFYSLQQTGNNVCIKCLILLNKCLHFFIFFSSYYYIKCIFYIRWYGCRELQLLSVQYVHWCVDLYDWANNLFFSCEYFLETVTWGQWWKFGYYFVCVTIISFGLRKWANCEMKHCIQYYLIHVYNNVICITTITLSRFNKYLCWNPKPLENLFIQMINKQHFWKPLIIIKTKKQSQAKNNFIFTAFFALNFLMFLLFFFLLRLAVSALSNCSFPTLILISIYIMLLHHTRNRDYNVFTHFFFLSLLWII